MTNEVLTPAYRKRASLITFLWVAVVFALILRIVIVAPSNVYVATESLVVFVAALSSLGLASRAGVWSPVALFLLVVGVFHLGLAPYLLFDIDPVFPRSSDYVWFHGEIGAMSFQLATVGVAAYTMAGLIAIQLRRRRLPVAQVVVIDEEGKKLSQFGALVLLVSVIAWFGMSVVAGGWSILTGSYTSYLAATATTSVDVSYYAMGFGLGLAVIRPPNALGRVAVGVFLVFALFGFFLGLRGEVLFPIAVACTVVGFRRRMPRGYLVVLGTLTVLTLVNIAKQVRQAGVGATDFDWVQASPLAALGELGSTLRVVATVVGWHEGHGETYRYGETYLVAIARAIETVTLGAGRAAAGADFRLFNVEIHNRAGAIGGSIIGEAFHNFAVPGVIVLLALIGGALGGFSNSRPTSIQLAVYVAIGVPLINHVRNSFVPVIPAVAAGIIAVLVVVAARARRRSRTIQ